MDYNIIRLTFSNETIEDYQQGIDDLLAIYATETEPFTLIADYSGYKDNVVVPVSMRLQALFRTWNAGRDSQWNKIYIAVNPTPENNFFLRWCHQSLSQQWTVHIASDIEDAYRIAGDIESTLSPHQ